MKPTLAPAPPPPVHKPDWLTAHWPQGVPDDCTKLAGPNEDSDCIELNRSDAETCESCKTYLRLLDERPESES